MCQVSRCCWLDMRSVLRWTGRNDRDHTLLEARAAKSGGGSGEQEMENGKWKMENGVVVTSYRARVNFPHLLGPAVFDWKIRSGHDHAGSIVYGHIRCEDSFRVEVENEVKKRSCEHAGMKDGKVR